jgi:D-alanyl-D-alanine carboxypeptidase
MKDILLKPGSAGVLAIITFLLALTSFGAGCGAESFSRETQDKLDSTLNDTMQTTKAPGALTGIWTPSGTWVVARGEANQESGLPMNTSDVFRIGSITKTFTATVVLQLVDEGDVNLDDQLAKYVPDFPNADRISIRQLLTHTSGIPEWAENDQIRQEVFDNPDQGWTVEKMTEIVGQMPLLFEPGTDYSYSNVGYFLLGSVIENASGKTVEENIDEKIAQPLGLKNTFLPDGPTFEGDEVHGYEELNGNVVDTTGTKTAEVVNYDLAYTAGGMVSTIDDLHVWSKALATGELLSNEMHQEQMPKDLKASPGSPVKSGYGMGVGQSDVWIGHSGAVSGFIANMGYYPEKDASIVTFFNKFTALEPEANAADLENFTAYFVELSKILFPETYEGVSLPESQE